MAGARPSALDPLFEAAPRDFGRERRDVAAALRAAGRVADAAAAGRMRKPPVAVWAANQVARRQPADLTRFIDAVERLRRAHGRSPGDVAAATAAEREALRAVVDHAAAALASAGLRGSPAMLARISATVLGSAADPDARKDLRAGRLTEERAAPGFEVLAGTKGSVSRPPDRPRPTDAPRRRPRPDATALRRTLREARQGASVAARRLREAERLATRRAREAERAAADLGRLEARLEALRRRAAAAAEASAAAAQAVEGARQEAAHRATALEDARRALRERRR
jgi:hypothetical protein